MLWAQDFELCEVANVANDHKLTNIHDTCFKCFKKMKILWIFQEDENQKYKKDGTYMESKNSMKRLIVTICDLRLITQC